MKMYRYLKHTDLYIIHRLVDISEHVYILTHSYTDIHTYLDICAQPYMHIL